MAHEILMPKLGLTMTEGTVGEWKFKEGDTVKKGDILLSVATDKLTNDVESEVDGVLLKILLPEGESAPCKAVIAYVGEAGEVVPEHPSSAEKAAAQPPAPASAPPPAPAAARAPGAPILASPAAKKLAKEQHVDLALLTGTGPKGRITLEDVQTYLADPKAAEPAAQVKTSPLAAKLAAELDVDVSKIDVPGRVMKADVLAAAGVGADASALPVCDNDKAPIKVNPLRRSIAANMVNSWHTSPRVTFTYAVDVTSMQELRTKLKDVLQEQGIKLTYNHILMKVVAQALTEFPDINASFSDNMLTRHKHVNMGLAVAKGDGLIVPNVKCAERKSLAEIAKEMEALIERTRSGKITMEDMTGGTFTISNLGSYGVRNFSPIINQPELAILGVCDIVDTPVVRNGEIVIRPMMNLCLTADHRVVDGVMACAFMKRVVELLENLYLLLI